jgi:hypothetical protein
MPTQNKTVRPEELATELGISGKIVRSYLRANLPRDPKAKNTAWVLTAKQAANVRDHFKSNQSKVEA